MGNNIKNRSQKHQIEKPEVETALDINQNEYAVFGFIRNIEQMFLSQIIPQSIKFLCLQYFGMNY